MSYQRFRIATPSVADGGDEQSVATVANRSSAPEPAPTRGEKTLTVALVATVAGVCADTAISSYSQDLAMLDGFCPIEDRERWLQARRDARQFLHSWGERAYVEGWKPGDLFGLHPTAPLARYDHMGLLWILRGIEIIELDALKARLANGQAYYRHPH